MNPKTLSNRNLLLMLWVFLDPAAMGLWCELARRLVARPTTIIIEGQSHE